jgi:hypothetical protein
MGWAKNYQTIKPYIMSVETPDGSGTAFLFTYNASKTIAGFATAAHVVDHANEWQQPIKLVHFTTRKEFFIKEEDRILLIDHMRDSASIFISNKNLGIPEDTLPLIDPTKILSIGVEVGWVGFPSIALSNLCLFTGRISAQVEGRDSYLIDGVAIHGVSGGPVLHYSTKDKQLRIIGTVSTYVSNKVYGETLPGLLRVQDVTSFHNWINTLRSLDEARKKQAEKEKEERDKSSKKTTKKRRSF